MEEKKIELVYGRGSRKSNLQRYYDWFLRTGFKLLQYEIYLETMEEHRNSFSKTDHDTTFMCLKKDFYLRNGITTPAYNCQIAVSSGYIVETLTCQFRADSPAWIPLMKQFYLDYGFYPSKPVVDAGDGNEENYQFNQKHGIERVQKYSMYDQKQKSSFKKKKFQRTNWKRDKDPHQRVFNELIRVKKQKTGT